MYCRSEVENNAAYLVASSDTKRRSRGDQCEVKSSTKDSASGPKKDFRKRIGSIPFLLCCL